MAGAWQGRAVDDDLFDRLAGIDGAALGEGAFAAGPAIWAGRREVAHLDAGGRLDVRLTRAVIRRRRQELRADAGVTLRAGTSDWVSLRLGEPGDEARALELVREAVAANLPGAPPGPPPEGAELARRRRFH